MTSRPMLNALILAEDEALLSLDKQVLRRLGVVRPIFFASGRKALDHLSALAAKTKCRAAGEEAHAVCAEPVMDMLICHERLADMSGLQFLAHVRKTAGLTRIPALLLVSNGESPIARAAVACNSCAVLARPYTEKAAELALATATTPEALHAPLVLPPSFVESFGGQTRALGERPVLSPLPLSKENRVKTTARQILKPAPVVESAESIFREGFAALRDGQWERAEKLLLKSYRLDSAHAETSLALSRVANEQGRDDDARIWLCRAGSAYLRANSRARAHDLFSRLPRGKNGQAPLLREAGAALEAGEVKAAALMFMEAHDLDPSVPLHAMISRACMFTPAPEEHIRGLIRALLDTGHASTAGRLQLRLLTNEASRGEEGKEGFLSRFPVLHDILSVAGHTFKAWRTAA